MLRKVHKKQIWHPPSAEDYNAMAMAGERYRAGPDRDPERQQPINPSTAWIKNSSGAARRQFECLELSVTPQLTDVTRENIWIDGIVPTDSGVPFAVLLQPVPNTKWALGQVDGICPGLVDIQDLADQWAYLPAGEYVLKSRATSGDVYIVQHPNSTGEQLCVVLFTCSCSELRGGCLAENHPGRGTVFEIYLGTWSSANNKWLYNLETEVKAIDWRFGVPYPDAGATGLFTARESDTYGTIWETVALDCTSPGACGS